MAEKIEELSPQARQMADESMVRNLASQAIAIWPQERAIFLNHALPSNARILDVGCGTGEITFRLAECFPNAGILGVDLEAEHLVRAQDKCRKFGWRVQFAQANALDLQLAADSYDLVVCRHVLQAVPDASKAVAEIIRVCRPHGRIHLLAEDYGMLLCHPTASDSDDFWQHVPKVFAQAIGCDNQIGRKMFTILTDAGMQDIAVNYMVVDTVRVDRNVFANIWEAWRDGYTDALAEHTNMPRAEIERRWQEMIDCARDPRGYALWQVPVWTARKPS